jgi:uncharacterized protein (DUF983 family)
MSYTIQDIAAPARNWKQAMLRGFRNTCPNCGMGKLFGAFLKPVHACAQCGEAMHHQRADDLPPYIVITIVGHIIVGMVIMVDDRNWPMWLHMAIWPPLTLILALSLMQPIKGAIIGLQWANRMHGFAEPDCANFPGHGDH